MRVAIDAAKSPPAGAGDSLVAFDFTSSVDAGRWKDVEALFFFHPRQTVLMDSIRASVEAHGAPEILRRGERIHIGIEKNGAQCLFACHGARRPGIPVGVVLYLRTSAETINILHLAVDAAYAHTGCFADARLAVQLVGEVRRLARRISGVRRVQLPYTRSSISVPRLAPDWALRPELPLR